MAKIDRERTPEEIAQGLRIRAFRIKLGYKRAEDFADDHDFARTQVSMWENGVRPGRPNLEKLAKALKVKPSDIGPPWVPTGRPKDYQPEPKSVGNPTIGQSTPSTSGDTHSGVGVGSESPPPNPRGVPKMPTDAHWQKLSAVWPFLDETARESCVAAALRSLLPAGEHPPLRRTGKG